MLVDKTAPDPAFESGRAPGVDLEPILRRIEERLGSDGAQRWTLISARRKLGKVLFEVDDGRRRLIGKIAKNDRSGTLWDALSQLWDAGFRPPARYTVTEPVVFLPEEDILLQEKAPGEQALDLILRSPEDAFRAADCCAEWLRAMHASPVQAKPVDYDQEAVATYTNGLAGALPDHADRLEQLRVAVVDAIRAGQRTRVPCHGDFHAMNIFIADDRITGIDLDKCAIAEPEYDAGYFLAQTAAFGYFETQGFDSTLAARQQFLRTYGTVDRRRAALAMAVAFLKNLHFELVLLDTGRTEYVEPWIGAAEQAILYGNIELTGLRR